MILINTKANTKTNPKITFFKFEHIKSILQRQINKQKTKKTNKK